MTTMPFVYKYAALFVPDLRRAETFYRETFALELLFRESVQEDGTWRTLRAELDWERAAERGIDVSMVALAREGVVLALFREASRPGALYELCLGVPPDEVDAIRARLGIGATILETRPGWLRFEDPFGIRWAVQPDDAAFRSSGEISGRWLS